MRDRRTLLQRLHRPRVARTRSSNRELAESVRENLEHVLGTRRGSSRAEPDYGLSDVGAYIHSFDEPPDQDLRHPDIRRLAGEIKELVEKFEPRLRVIHCRPSGKDVWDSETKEYFRDPFCLQFTIYATLLWEGEEQGDLHWTTTVDFDGRSVHVTT